jgi:hypothetical protein
MRRPLEARRTKGPEADPRRLEAALSALKPYFRGLEEALIVPIERTRRLHDDPPDKIRSAAELMAAAAAGQHPKREPLTARAELDGTYTVLDGKATHTNLEIMGIDAVPLIVRRG